MSKLVDTFLTTWSERWPDADVPVREYRFCERRWRFDLAWPGLRAAVEINGMGYGHQSITAVARDAEKQREAMRLGWLVVPFTSKCLGSKDKRREAVELVMGLLMDRGAG